MKMVRRCALVAVLLLAGCRSDATSIDATQEFRGHIVAVTQTAGDVTITVDLDGRYDVDPVSFYSSSSTVVRVLTASEDRPASISEIVVGDEVQVERGAGVSLHNPPQYEAARISVLR